MLAMKYFDVSQLVLEAVLCHLHMMVDLHYFAERNLHHHEIWQAYRSANVLHHVMRFTFTERLSKTGAEL